MADPDEIAKERLILAQKYGYDLPDLSRDPQKHMLLAVKDPGQVFFGLEPGMLINLRDRVVYKPTDKQLLKYYSGG